MLKGFNRCMRVWMILTFTFIYIPIVAIIFMSFNSTPYGLFPFEFTTKWYITLFTTSTLLQDAWISLQFSLAVALVAIVVGTMAAMGLQYWKPAFVKKFNSLVELPIIIPWLVTSISILLLLTFLGSGRSWTAMFLGSLSIVLPYVILLVNGRFVEFDRSPESAARLLGASPLRVFFDITLPAILPGVMAGGIMSLIVCFNCFCIQYYLVPFGTNTLPVEVFTRIKSGYQADLNALSAIIVLISVVIVILFSRMGYSAGSLFGTGSSSHSSAKKGD